jgi:carboxypeptidase Taq
MSPYQELEGRFRRIAVLGDAERILHWDMSTLMPPGGAKGRAEQLAVLKVVRHGTLADPQVGDLLAESEAEAGLDAWQAANLAGMRREWRHATALEPDLVEALSRAACACEMIWRDARAAADFAAVAPALRGLLALVRQAAAAKAEALGCSPYDALLDEFEPGGRSAEIDRLFESLAEDFLPDFLGRALERQDADPAPVALEGRFAVEAQRELGLVLMKALGFDFDRGRLDVSLHPFCGGASGDVRITTRYDDADFTTAVMAVLHETGHALYEQGLPSRWRYQPVGRACGMSLHESQALIIEMQACRSREFFEYAAPVMANAFGAGGTAWTADNLHRLSVRIEPGPIRVDADEVTYPAHVIQRYRLEKAMIAGELEADDLPAAWNEGMKVLLGLAPADDAEGCLQDIHWFEGAWGYFPTYTLGAMTAAQLFEAACRAEPGILPGLAGGDFTPLVAWLRDNVHAKASHLPASDLLAEATGRPLDAHAFKSHLERRYLA